LKFWRNFYKFILSDPRRKIISLLLSCFLWYYVNVISIEKTYLNLPIRIINIPAKLNLEYLKDPNVKIELQSQEDISAHIKNVEAIVDLSNYNIGINNYPIEIHHLPSNIQMNYTPQVLQINIYSLLTKIVPVNLILSDKNNLITNYLFTPQKVSISGKENIIRNIEFLKTKKIIIENEFNNIYQTNIDLIIPAGISVLQGNSIEVTLLSQNFNITNRVILPIDTKSLTTGFSIKNLPNIPLTVISSKSNIESLLLQTIISLELDTINSAGEFPVSLIIKSPHELKIINPPSRIDIKIISNKNVQEFVNPIIDLINKNSNTNS